METQVKKSKSQVLAEEYGFSDVQDLVMDYMMSGSVPAICTNKSCDAIYEYEPDQDRGWCENCKSNSVKSALILTGLI